MAGGGSIPFEARRLGLDVIANDSNPVAYICLKGTVEYPARFGKRLIPVVKEFCEKIHLEATKELEQYFPKQNDEEVYTYLWARTLPCPHCNFSIPLSPNWWIVKDSDNPENSVAAQPIINIEKNRCDFNLVNNPIKTGFDPEKGTASEGDCLCPKCKIPIKSDKIKELARGGKLGDQLYGVCTKISKLRGKGKEWIFRAPTKIDLDAIREANQFLTSNFAQYCKNNLIPTENIPKGLKTREPLEMGITKWSHFFNSRQLLTHAIYLKKFNDQKHALISRLRKDTDEWEFATA